MRERGVTVPENASSGIRLSRKEYSVSVALNWPWFALLVPCTAPRSSTASV
jgi:hypothetical protein